MSGWVFRNNRKVGGEEKKSKFKWNDPFWDRLYNDVNKKLEVVAEPEHEDSSTGSDTDGEREKKVKISKKSKAIKKNKRNKKHKK